ncbi:hypothetical protein [Botrimarina colliarenosi]|uniref:hypothetical protein n=1 Tax=Botrimarina colliarenosi TaxID=2528001 RepID=UPI0011B76639|nr:hypothetical protein [Botrimarina colliarenosi]
MSSTNNRALTEDNSPRDPSEQTIRLTASERRRFCDLCLSPPPLAEPLKTALKRRKEIVEDRTAE